MDIGILHTHTLTVVLYLALFAIKAVLILTKQKNLLATVNGKTRVLHIVLATTMLATGLYSIFRAPDGTAAYNVVKITVLAATMGTAIVAVRRFKAAWAVAALAGFVYVFLLSKTRDVFLRSEEVRVKAALQSFEPVSPRPDVALARGKTIYEIACVRCHGLDGQSGYRKAFNLQTSLLADPAVVATIANGRNTMPAYPYLSKNELEDLAAYVKSLRK
ncbi:MAG: c-type cytochrome [Bacteroidia bacterium]|nr:c-type cytochrome [Bacteroidia bacterium]MDW8334182.1 c-type cytochrome [Bacteroidia bacterium]